MQLQPSCYKVLNFISTVIALKEPCGPTITRFPESSLLRNLLSPSYIGIAYASTKHVDYQGVVRGSYSPMHKCGRAPDARVLL